MNDPREYKEIKEDQFQQDSRWRTMDNRVVRWHEEKCKKLKEKFDLAIKKVLEELGKE